MRLTETPVSELPGVGEKRVSDLAELGIKVIADLLTYFPYRYIDYQVRDLNQAQHDEKITIKGEIVGQPSIRWFGKKKSRLTLKLRMDEVYFSVVWFNQPFLKDRLRYGQEIVIAGRWDQRRRQLTAERTFLQETNKRFEPVYSVTSQIKIGWLRKQIHEAFRRYGKEIPEILPADLLQRYRLVSRAKAMYWLHFPGNKEEAHQARRRMAYEELFLYELRLMWLKKQNREMSVGIAHTYPMEKVDQLIRELSFPLTKAQKRVVQEILRDLESPYPMNRLLQGDVGSGKTVVAAITLYANYLSGYQGALMVPTEILAEQHKISLQKWLSPLGIRVITLTGRMTAKERREAYAQIEMGTAHVIVGTHALIQETVVFNRLGIVITDEQHRFGVKQRSLLREKGETPDVLFMTATPIPRTLAITAFGEMDVSTLDEMPAGREPVATHWVKKELWERVVQFIAKECTQGNQAYVVCPLIEESEKLDLQNAEDLLEQLTLELSPIRVGLLHGRMNAENKEAVMQAFAMNEVQVLVSTTVIEVGVNVPNATVMVIYDADRFGLAQLHQLRGRVGRGGGAATCILVANPKGETSVERMRVMSETNDGFEISRRDLALRGPGDFLGMKQSGLPDFRIANLEDDQKILEVARADAAELVGSPDFETDEKNESLHQFLEQENKKTLYLD